MAAGMVNSVMIQPALAQSTPNGAVAASMAQSVATAALQDAMAAAGSMAVGTLRNLWPSNTRNIAAGGFNNGDGRYGAYTSGPDGSYETCQLLLEANPGSGSVVHWFYIYGDVGAGQHTISMHFKPDVRTWVYLTTTVDGTARQCWFDLGAGAVGTNNFPGGSATITAAGAGFYRCSVTFTATTSALYNGCGLATADAVLAYTAIAGDNGAYQWGQQLENGPLTEYQSIPASR
jgi:hypothetical protein